MPGKDERETKLSLSDPAGPTHTKCAGANQPPPVTETDNLPVRLKATRLLITKDTTIPKDQHNQRNPEDKDLRQQPL